MDEQEKRAQQRIQLIAEHVKEQREHTANLTQASHALAQQHEQEKVQFKSAGNHNPLAWASLVNKQSEQLFGLSTQQSQERLALLSRQEQEFRVLPSLP